MTTEQSWLDTRLWLDREEADIDSYFSDLDDLPTYDLRSKLYAWRDRGIVVFENAVDADLLELLIRDIDEVTSGRSQFDLDVEYRGAHVPISSLSDSQVRDSGFKLNNLHTLSPATERIGLVPDVADFLRHVFRDPPATLQTLTFVRGSEQPIHIDYPYVREQQHIAHLAASWIPLEDIHPDAGPLSYFPGSHKPDVCGFFDWGHGSILMEDDSIRTPAEFSAYLDARVRTAGICPGSAGIGKLAYAGS